ncbi:MAG TPA: hypothetical protein VME21_14600 [Steroidobacteraceae bacterium]|nr:hypothetical protein [Steroidobacteraceae bacterium]
MAVAEASCVLVRTTQPDAAACAFARRLSELSGLPAVLVADERHSADYSGELPLIRLTQQACAALGLYCPEDFAWRCGDYGYYLAHKRSPDTLHFWMIETDVHFGEDAGRLFGFFASQPQVDLLCAQLEPADRSWFWMDSAAARDIEPFRCLFPVTRLSARAIDAALRQRRLHSRRMLRRQLWPNDEALIATTLVNAGFECRDFNDFGTRFYAPETFSYWQPLDAERLPEAHGVCMMHPVLSGEAHRAKLASRREQPQRSWLEIGWRRNVARMNRRLRPW